MILNKKNRRQFLVSSSGALVSIPFLESLADPALGATSVNSLPIFIHFVMAQGMFPRQISKFEVPFGPALNAGLTNRWYKGVTKGGNWVKRGEHFHTLPLAGTTPILGSVLDVLSPYKSLVNVYQDLYRTPGNGTHDAGWVMNANKEIKIPGHVNALGLSPSESLCSMLSRRYLRETGLLTPAISFGNLSSVNYTPGIGNRPNPAFSPTSLTGALNFLFPLRGKTEDQQRAIVSKQKSVLDNTKSAYQLALNNASSADRMTLENYMDSLRSVELRLANFVPETGMCNDVNIAIPGTAFTSLDIHQYMNLTFDLSVLALSCGKTSAISFFVSDDVNRRHLASQVSAECATAYHGFCHGTDAAAPGPDFDNRSGQIEIVQRDEMSIFKSLIDKLAASSIGSTTLLSRTLLTVTSDAAGSNHDGYRRWVVTVGNAGGKIETGNIISLAKTNESRNYEYRYSVPASSPASSVFYGLAKGLGISDEDSKYGSGFVEGDSKISAERQRSGYPVLLKG